MAVESIAKTLGTGSGIDTSALVKQLVEAQFAVRNAQLTRKSDSLTTQISTAAALKNAIGGFSSALTTLAKSGDLTTQPTSGDPSIVTVAALPGARLNGLNATIEVRQLAAAQTASVGPIAAGATAPTGTGTLTFTFGKATVSNGAMTAFDPGTTPVTKQISIGPDDATLEGVMKKINASDLGITASILTDSAGARLVLKGTQGEAEAFTITATEDSGAAGLAALEVGVGEAGSAIATAAADAIVALDGVAVKRATNVLSGLIPGARVELMSAQVGTVVRIGATPPTDSIRLAVSDFVDTFNQLHALIKEGTAATDSPLRSDPAAKALSRAMSGLTLTELLDETGLPEGAPTTLAALGIGTNRDGTLKIDAEKLTLALTNHPEVVEAMFADGTGAKKGLPAALAAISTAATSATNGLGASEARYTKLKAEISEDQTDAVADADRLRARMTQQFASMDAKVAAYKSTQTFLEQQIDAWNSQDR